MIYLILVVYIIEWAFYGFVQDQWSFLLGTKTLTCALSFTALLIYTNKCTLLVRSIIAWVAIDAWCNVVEFSAWQLSNESLNSTWICAFAFFLWLLFIVKRQYPERIDLVDLNNINILIKKPKTTFDIISGLIGLSASSICICTDNCVWCFRKKSGIFEKSEYRYQWTESHLVIDTGIKCTQEHKLMLDNLIGTVRYPCIKCVYTIRYLLNTLGYKYSIKTWFDYIPGIYFMRVI